jgi:hypothetical protein
VLYRHRKQIIHTQISTPSCAHLYFFLKQCLSRLFTSLVIKKI